MQCVRTPSRDYGHAAFRMNEIGEEKKGEYTSSCQEESWQWNYALSSASGPRPTTTLVVFDTSNNIESHLCPTLQKSIPRLSRNDSSLRSLLAYLPRICPVHDDAVIHFTASI